MNEIKIEMFAFYDNEKVFDIGNNFIEKISKEAGSFSLTSRKFPIDDGTQFIQYFFETDLNPHKIKTIAINYESPNGRRIADIDIYWKRKLERVYDNFGKEVVSFSKISRKGEGTCYEPEVV